MNDAERVQKINELGDQIMRLCHELESPAAIAIITAFAQHDSKYGGGSVRAGVTNIAQGAKLLLATKKLTTTVVEQMEQQGGPEAMLQLAVLLSAGDEVMSYKQSNVEEMLGRGTSKLKS